MIYLLIYLAIGAVVSIRLPIAQARARKKLQNISTQRVAAMTPAELKVFGFLAASTATNYKTWHLVVAGLIWPTNLIAIPFAHIYGGRIRRRADRMREDRAVMRKLIPCPGCERDLADVPLTDCIEDHANSQVRFVCGACSTVSDWNAASFPPTLVAVLETIRKDVIPETDPPPPPTAA